MAWVSFPGVHGGSVQSRDPGQGHYREALELAAALSPLQGKDRFCLSEVLFRSINFMDGQMEEKTDGHSSSFMQPWGVLEVAM